MDGSENAEKISGYVRGLAQPLGTEVALITIVDPDKIELPRSTAMHGHPIPGQDGQFDRPGVETSGGLVGTIGGGVATPDTPGHGGGVEHAPGFGTQIVDQVIEQANAYVDRIAGQMNAAGIRATSKALVGDPAEAIVQHAHEIEADVIAMATHRGSAIVRGVLGSVTDRVIHSAGIPVMAIHPESLVATGGLQGRPESILVPLDGSARSAGVVEMAIGIAKAAGAEIVFFQAVRHPFSGLVGLDTPYGYSAESGDAHEYLTPFQERAEAAGVRARLKVVTGSPAPRILEAAKELPTPLVVMSTRGVSGIKRWILGSVTDKVIRSSGLPVIVVPPPVEVK